jgi:NAD(P)-dependent dehydrogenase (short-subunit alcohol dehydrogenase family)
MTLQGKVALVAGATLAAGRGIAVQLGAAAATVYVTAITSHFAIPLMIRTAGGLVVEMTDGTNEYNAA